MNRLSDFNFVILHLTSPFLPWSIYMRSDQDPPWPAFDERPSKRFDLIPFDQITCSSAPAYLVKGLLPRVGLAVMWGPPKCGKSFLAFDLMMHIALGWSYRDRRVQQGAVIYCALEGAEGFKARVEAFRTAKMAETATGVPFFLSPTPLNLVADHQALEASIRAAPVAPAVIVIDTVNRSLAGSESDDRDMGAYIKAADALKAAFGCLVLVVHHSGVDTSRPRGHTSLAGAVDAQIGVKKDGETVVATLQYCKDGPEGESVASRLTSVEIGLDDEGDPITSCIVEPVEHVPAAAKEKKGPKLPDRVRLGLDVLVDTIITLGEALPSAYQIPGNPRAVKAAAWRDALFSRGVLDRDAKNPREDFARIKRALLAKRLAGERDGLVWAVAS